MHDIRVIRTDPAAFDAAMARRGLPPVSSEILAIDTNRRAAQTALQEKQARRNALAKEIGQGKRTGADTATLEAEATTLRGDMESLEKSVPTLDADIKRILEALLRLRQIANHPRLVDPDSKAGSAKFDSRLTSCPDQPGEVGRAPSILVMYSEEW